MLFSKLISLFLSLVLSLRYRIRLHGLEKVMKQKGGKGILFLPNHPALIDPPVIASILIGRFRPYIIVDDEQIRTTVIKHFVKQARLLSIPDISVVGAKGGERVKAQFSKCVSLLNEGANVLMYPSGRIYRSRYENLRGNTGTHLLLSQAPDIRVVMIRTTGLWGSSFSRSCGFARPFSEIFRGNLKHLFKSLIFFLPRRPVDVTFEEVSADFPRSGTKEEINRCLEKFYNADAPANTYVPYSIWEKGGIHTIAEPNADDMRVDTSAVPADVREKVYAKLREVASVKEISDQAKLGADLGMDSLMIYGVLIWLQEEFGKTVNNPETLVKVADVLLAAIGRHIEEQPLSPVPPTWFIPADDTLMKIPPNCPKVTDTYLYLASKKPDFPLLADQKAGVLTNRKIILSIMALRSVFKKLPGERIGIIMPACAAFFPIYMALLYSGKIPVILNWTVGPRNLEACVRKADLSCILSSELVIQQLEGHGTDFSGIKDKISYLEDLKNRISLFSKLLAAFNSRFCWHSLRSAKVPETSAILFTSGSESEPKAVPITHANSMNDVEYAIKPMKLRNDDCILGMLPPFHSFGLLINVMVPALTNMRIIYHSNPMEGNFLAKLIGAYHPTLIVGTPTFAEGILKNASQEQVSSIRIIITGAEKCPVPVLELCHEKCPSACFLEGYGITECGPIVAVNQPGASKINTIGHFLGCLDWMICGENGEKLPPNQTGMLNISGPTIFGGYLAYDGPSPFFEQNGRKWYRTGDLVQIDDEGYVTFKGRLKRFIKVAGEMVSLPAVEEALLERYADKAPEKGAALAVEAIGPDNDPEIILFTVFDTDRNTANQFIREAGFSSIHYVKRIVKLNEIPLLGTGKTDYRKLKTMV